MDLVLVRYMTGLNAKGRRNYCPVNINGNFTVSHGAAFLHDPHNTVGEEPRVSGSGFFMGFEPTRMSGRIRHTLRCGSSRI